MGTLATCWLLRERSCVRHDSTAAVAAWIALAQTDLRMARLAFADDPPMFRQVCFHSQQVAEKMLKAMPERQGLATPRTHDLLVLVDALQGNRKKHGSGVSRRPCGRICPLRHPRGGGGPG